MGASVLSPQPSGAAAHALRRASHMPTGGDAAAGSAMLRLVALTAADPLLVVRRHVDFLRIGSALCLPRPLTSARHS
jgi:hypothetical protein